MAYTKMVRLDRVSLKPVRVTSRAQMIRAMMVGVFFALIFISMMPGGLHGI